jgi:CelD/BcsL family acetyltransferase involved in cellulose biosynthesis
MNQARGLTERQGSSDRAEAATFQLEEVGDFNRLAAAWRGLAMSSRNVFSTLEWAETWWQNFGNDQRLLVFVCRDANERPFAILPLSVTSKRLFRIIRFMGHGLADELGPVCDPADRRIAAQALRRALSEYFSPSDLFVGEHLPCGEPWTALLRGERLSRDPSPVLYPQGRSWEEFVASQSANFREQVRRRERKLQREHGANYRLADPSSLERDFEIFLQLHQARWGTGSSSFADARAAFHRDFAAKALERGWLRLWFMEIDNRPVAAWYGFRFADIETFYQAGRDPAWDGYSVGFVLLTHTMREAFNDGVAEYRLLRGREPYKLRFTVEDPGVETILVSLGLPARSALAIARALPGPGRRLLSRASGFRLSGEAKQKSEP